jgi:serine protease
MLACAGIGNAASATICGDADGDGVVTITDGVRILRLAAALDETCATTGCDVDGSGQVSVTDAVLALRRAAGLTIVDVCGGGTITGRLLVPPAPAAAIVEREPNDAPSTANVVGWTVPGETRAATGAVGDDDPFDGWTFVGDGGLALDLTLTFAADTGVDLDLLVDDRLGGSATCERTTAGREHCRVDVGSPAPAPFDVVVAPASGSRPAAYELVVSATATHARNGVTARAGAGAAIDVVPAAYRGEAAETVAGELVVQLELTNAVTTVDPLRSVARQALAAAGIDDDLRTDAVAPDGTRLVTLPRVQASAAMTGVDPDAALAAKRARAWARQRTEAVAATLAMDPTVRLAVPNRIVRGVRMPRDPLYPRQWHLDAIGLPRAWDVTIGRASTIVAVVDTGIRSDHPDLAGRLVPGFDFISNAARANDGDGLDPDPFDPGDQPSRPDGGTFHGTHVAGTIAAATDDTLGVAGVTWRTAVMPLRVLGVGGGTIFDVAQAVRFAAGLSNTSGTVPPAPARIINLSLATSGNDPVLRSAVDAATDAGALVVAAAGNTGNDRFLSPAGFPNVLSIAATDRLGAPARYSSFGAAVDLAAPGGDTHVDRDVDGFPDGILSTLLPGRADYGLMQGTSMAAAHASGVAALLLGVPGGASAARLREVLLATADDRGAPGRDDRYGAGIIDAARAVRALAGLPSPPDPEFALVTPAVRAEIDESVLHVPFRNVGGGALVLETPTVTTEDGIPWLSADVEAASIRLEIDRDALAPGPYVGRVDVESNGGRAVLTVVAEVAATPQVDVGPVAILLHDVATQAIVATTTTTVADGYGYRFDDVPPGSYEILATTDRDGDGALCDVGESCGAYPTRGDPSIVTVVGGTTIRARDFALDVVISVEERRP